MIAEELANKKVKDIVQDYPSLSGVLNKYGFDFCCGGNKVLKDVCVNNGVNLADVISDMQSVIESRSVKKEADNLETSELISHILETHHEYLKDALPEIEFFSNKVAMRHGERHPELIEINRLYTALKDELDNHLVKEENILFPLIGEVDSRKKNQEKMEAAHCGSVNNPIRVMNSEHESTKELLSGIRKLTNGYYPPEDACNSYRLLYQKLEEMETDLLEHMRLETDILFPRASILESQLA
ncbi:MAG: iron-sulfur cluster repair di-iron protein [Leptospiraceae bacterium]|nr:iron-sulfur cluster repair di-iron protein [Leptospiraceae bacterium]MCK6381293.1 iron-sulfur cluster repair di-iron protein [Leptospiraceae bacterium]NUM40394.1 iron-sulfur cluster repair di-iron protein [Leptospiraceae bacterium]